MEASQIQHGEPRRLVMSAPTPLRQDFDASQLRGLARKTKDGPQARRLLALAAIYNGATRTEAAKIGGVGLQIIRDWALRFNARGPDGLLDGNREIDAAFVSLVQARTEALRQGGLVRADHIFRAAPFFGSLLRHEEQPLARAILQGVGSRAVPGLGQKLLNRMELSNRSPGCN